jgi:hypothetical protein
VDLLELAFYLSILSYVIGQLLKALPLPFISIKKLGRMLVLDGLFSAVLVFSYKMLIDLVDYIGSILGANWSIYFVWLSERITILMLVLIYLKGLSITLSKFGLGPLVNGFLSHISNLVSTSLTTMIVTTYISTILYLSSKALIPLGIVLHAVPFRLTRNIGATIIAFVMVFSIGLPLMPIFIDRLVGGVGLIALAYRDICSTNITLKDALGRPFGSAVIEGYYEGELLYRYVIKPSGILTIDTLNGFPCTSHTLYLLLVDLVYTTDVPSGGGGSQGITLIVPSVYSIAPNRFVHISGQYEVVGVERSSIWLNITINAYGTVNITLYHETKDQSFVYIDGQSVEPQNSKHVEWYGLDITASSYILNQGLHVVDIYLDWRGVTELYPDIHPYIMKYFGIDLYTIENFIYITSLLFLQLTILPIVYISMLIVISFNLAKLLGGAFSGFTKLLVV